MAKNGKRYSPKFKFQLVLETLQREGADAEVARSYGVHPVTLSKWRREFLEKGAEVFGSSAEVAEYEKRVGDLERMVGQKEVEIALLKNFLNGR
jgi:transposase-like protein